MEMVFIYGPPAVGKLTVAKDLSALTGFRLFVNHQASDLVQSILDFEKDPSLFRRVSNEVKNLILEKAVDIGLPGLIMTFCYSRPDSDKNLCETMEILQRKGVDMSFVRLYCEDKELFKRVEDPSRKLYSSRKLSSPVELQQAMNKHGFKEEISYVNSLSIDNTSLSSKEVAEIIARHYQFPPHSQTD